MQETFIKLSEQKQLQILMAAIKVFAQKGYFQANVADICKEAGISNGALYKYFVNKESLFMSCIELGIELMSEEIFAKGLSKPGSFYEKVRHLLKTVSEFSKKNSSVVAIYMDLSSMSYNKFADIVSQKIEETGQAFQIQLVKEAIENGEIDLSVDPNIAAYIIDNNMMILAFSIVSKHYQKRFQAYFGSEFPELDEEKKIDIIMRSIKQLLQP